ncbi:serine--tRNA ligase [Desulfurispira natronophila]|uniref:Serine--tRNA ligase n=1 Tax=Desulfurispira natronophila TaxID=682562 RepID=A0A7W7Y5L9_9BACT|nr:serine--tRNA ligase [Desulfurispira natronophila]MBB5022489.1 seryl-tRNA synthetase [Desulfurispira natronophila]
MLDMKRLRDERDKFEKRLQLRDPSLNFNNLLELDDKRRQVMAELQHKQGLRNETSKKIGVIKKQGGDASEIMGQMKTLSEELKSLENHSRELEEALQAALLQIPNIPHEDVPAGASEEQNIQLRQVGTVPSFDFAPRSHDELGVELDILDFSRGVKIAQSRFVIYKGLGARLERALINFMLDEHQQTGYTEILPPLMVNRTAMTGTGQLPKFEDDLFSTEEGQLLMIPTAEVPLTNMHSDEILKEEQLPLRYTAYTPCFRREAGSYGKDTKGLIRQHQFNKVELVGFCHPEHSYANLDELLQQAEQILQKLHLPYRVVELCSGDLGFSAARTYDIEVWVPSQKTYREISSCSNFEDFQSRRAKIRYKDSQGKNHYLHTINGSGLAVGRTVVAILENCQNADGSVTIPSVLIPYMGGIEKISAP